MTKNPFYNALAAFIYIVLIVLLMTYTGNIDSPSNEILAPIMMLSLFTLSAAVMAYIFLYQPIMLYIDNKKDKAVKLFIQTVAIFALLTLIPFIVYLTGILS
jgi:hypothetical protein